MPAKFRKRREPRKTKAAPLAPLVLTAVTDVSSPGGGELDLTVVFDNTADAPLVGIDAADPGKWSAVYGGDAYFGNALEMIAFNQIRIVFFSAGNAPGADSISYAADPSDILNSLGGALAAVSDFPL